MCAYMITASGRVVCTHMTEKLIGQKSYLLLMVAQGLWYRQGVASGEGTPTHMDPLSTWIPETLCSSFH